MRCPGLIVANLVEEFISIQGFNRYIMGLNTRKPVFESLRTTKVQTSLRSLISAFVIRLLESIISRLATRKISIF